MKDLDETKEHPILSREQQAFLLDIKQLLLDTLSSISLQPDKEDEEIAEYLLIKALFKLPSTELNIYLMRQFGNYKSDTELAKDISVTKQTISKHLSHSKTYISNYVKHNFQSITNKLISCIGCR